MQVILNDNQTIPSALTVSAWESGISMKPPMSLNPDECNRSVYTLDEKVELDTQRTCVVRGTSPPFHSLPPCSFPLSRVHLCDVLCTCNCCAEPIMVRVSMVNQLQIEVSVSRLQLRCVLDSNTTSPSTTAPPPPSDAASSFSASNDLLLDTQSLVLPPNSITPVTLRVTAQREGVLRIDGVSWAVSDVIHGLHRFALPDKQWIQKKGRRRMQKTTPNTALIVPITPPLPLLRFEWVQFPERMYHGIVIRLFSADAFIDICAHLFFSFHSAKCMTECTGECVLSALRLVNFGQIALDSLAVKLSHPAFISIPKLASSASSPSVSASGEGKQPLPSASEVMSEAARSVGVGGKCYDYDWMSGVVDLGLQVSARRSAVCCVVLCCLCIAA